MKNTTFRIVATLLVVVCLCIGFVVPTQTTAQAKTATDLPAGYEEVFSYEDVFAHYYNSAQNQLAQRNARLTMSYEQFCSSYYKQQLPIGEFTESVVDEELENQGDSANATPRDSSLSEDEDYILTSLTDYATTPASAFRRVPNYNGYQGKTFDYSLLKDGDIVYETKTKFATDHSALISVVSKSSAYGNYVQTIEAVGDGVQFGFLDDNRMVEFGVKILRPNATRQQRLSAISFAKTQLGKPYHLPIPVNERNTSANSPDWYCSELIYAAYYNSGVDIAVFQKANGQTSLPASGGVLPQDLDFAMNTYIVNIQHIQYLDIELVYGDRWQVRIYNKYPTPYLVSYNAKMCTKNDAENWTNLNDLVTVNIPANSYVTVTISEKFLCGYIVVGCQSGNARFVTYANGLQAGPYHMNIYSKTLRV